MNCKDVREMIPLYHYKELEGDRAGDVRSHLSSCADCRRELELIGRVLEKVTVPEVPKLPDEFWARGAADIMRRVRKERILSRTAVPFWAAAVAAVVFGLFMIRIDLGLRRDSDVVRSRKAVSVSDDVGTELEIEALAVEIGDFWRGVSTETPDEISDGFDSEFARNLDAIEVSIESLFMEFEAVDPWKIGMNGSV